MRALLVRAALLAATTLPCSAIAADDTAAKADTPLLRAERTLRDFGGKARDAASDITSYALSLIGVNYKFGGNTPEQGLDCSGLIRYVFQQATGIALPRTAREQARVGETVAIDKLQPGDLVFFNTRRFQFSHVGLYLGENRFIHAPSRGGAVEVVSLEQKYWQKAFNGARRIVGGLPDLSLVVPSAEAAPPAAPTALPASSADNLKSRSSARPATDF